MVRAPRIRVVTIPSLVAVPRAAGTTAAASRIREALRSLKFNEDVSKQAHPHAFGKVSIPEIKMDT